MQPINEALIDLILLAISDILCASRVWLGFGYHYIHCDTTAHNPNFYVEFFVDMYIIVLNIGNCWMTFYLAARRCRIVFDFRYARDQLSVSTSLKFRHAVGYGFLFGIIQGEHKV